MTTSLQLGVVVAGGPLATVHRGSLGGRAVAVKRARPDVPGAAAALRREARVLTAATHPAIVPVLDVLEDPAAPALVLGWADGGSLGDLLADGPLPNEELVHVLRPLAGGLEALHRAGAVHLDVTVENVLLAAAGPILIDPAPPGAGTPGYADPVVAAGGPASSRSDVFGLAACAHVALTGRLPRVAGGVATGLVLPGAVTEALAAGLHPQPSRRPISPSAFVDRLAAALTDSPLTPSGKHTGGAPDTPAAGRPATRASRRPTGTARTWPFDRWQEEADTAEDRQAVLAALIGKPVDRRRHRRRRVVVILGLFAVGILVVTIAVRSAWADNRTAPVRPSASDSTQRPPATRPPPTTTLGGKP